MTFKLQSLHILERTQPGDWLWAWSYPDIEDSVRTICKRKCQASEKYSSQTPFQFFHLGNDWVYLYFSDSAISKAQNVIVLCTSDFNTAKYGEFMRICSEQYSKVRKPVELLKTFISALTKGHCAKGSNETFYLEEFEQSISWKYHVSDIISRFGLETILIYMALLLKKRIAVYHHDVGSRVEFMLRLPAFVVHRDFSDSLYPWVDDYKDELEYFTENKFHILGCTNSSIESSTELYDLYVNVPASEISVAPHAKDILSMTKHHKNIAVFMVQLLEKKSLTERDIVYEISQKTKELTAHLKQFCSIQAGENVIVLNEMKQRGVSPVMEAFFINLARAEDIRVI